MSEETKSVMRPFWGRREKIAALASAGMLALITVLLWPDREEPTPVILPELELADAIRRNGLFYAPGVEEAFSGLVVEHYDDGQLKARCAVRNGQLEGLTEGWHPNGQLQVSESFRQGESHGIRTKWRADGSKLSEGQIENGAFEGIYRKWHPNGQLAQEIAMVEGQAHGLCRAFDEEGALTSRVLMEGGEIVEQRFFGQSSPSNPVDRVQPRS